MASEHDTHKKRPPPIRLPPPYLQPVLPGPNAFAIAERAEEERRRKAAVDQVQQAWNPSTEYRENRVAYQGSSRSLSTKGGYSNLNDQVQKSPHKSSHSQNSRHGGSTTRSKHSERTEHSATSAHRQLDLRRPEATSRAAIEEKQERKLMKLMGQVPDTPTDGTALPSDNYVSVNDLRQGRATELSKGSDKEIATRSPKKKIFGIGIPFSSRSMKDVPAPPMPAKAAKLMGAPPQKGRKFSPLSKFAGGVGMMRSDTSKSLPAKVFNQPAPHGRRRSPVQLSPKIRTSPKGRTSRSPPKRKLWLHQETYDILTGANESRPPLPPRKDSFPERKDSLPQRKDSLPPRKDSFPPRKDSLPPRKDSLPPEFRYELPQGMERRMKEIDALSAGRTISQLLRPPTPETEVADFKDSGMRLELPYRLPMDPIPRQGGETPSKYCPPSEKPEVVHQEPIFSAHGTFENVDEDEELADRLSYDYAVHRSAPASPITSTSAHLAHGEASANTTVKIDKGKGKAKEFSPQLEYLLPRTYRPPPKKQVRKKAAEQEPEFLRSKFSTDSSSSVPSSKAGSIPIWFQGKTSEIDPQSATARALAFRADEPGPSSVNTARQASREIHNPDLAARLMQELRVQRPTGRSGEASTNNAMQPEQSSSQLTDMLNGVSPDRAPFAGYASTSAVPSPLHNASQDDPGSAGRPRQPAANAGPSQQPAGTVGTQQPVANGLSPHTGQAPPQWPARPPLPPIVPRTIMSMHDHFFMTNEHIDVVALSVHDWVQGCSEHAINIAGIKHDQLKTAVDRGFAAIRSQINSIGEETDHNGNQIHNLGVQLDKLRDLIKSEVIDPLAAQTARLNTLDHNLKELQKSVQDLQSQASSGYMSSPQQQNLPMVNSRSQPTFPPFYDPHAVSSGSVPPMPPLPHAYGRYGNTQQQQLGRMPYSRGSIENSNNYRYPNMGNPYLGPDAPYNHGHATGGYQQPPLTNVSPHEVQSQGHNQGYPE